MKCSIGPMLFLLLATVFTMAGCESEPPAQPQPENDAQSTASQGAAHVHTAGPHDGTIADWGGGKYHVEFTVNHDQQEATVYILGDDAKTPVPIDASTIQLSIRDPSMQVDLSASPLEDDPESSASRFVGQHASLGVVQEYAGTITGVVDGVPYSGDFKEEPHDPHDH